MKPGSIILNACCACFVGRPATRNTSWLFIVMLLFSLSFFLWMDGIYNPLFGAAFCGKVKRKKKRKKYSLELLEVQNCALRLLTSSSLSLSAMMFVFSGALLGFVSSIVVIFFYVLYPKLRTHTNRILFWRTCCDCGMALLILYYSLEAFGRDPSKPAGVIHHVQFPPLHCVCSYYIYLVKHISFFGCMCVCYFSKLGENATWLDGYKARLGWR
jgi:hypothetical protein